MTEETGRAVTKLALALLAWMGNAASRRGSVECKNRTDFLCVFYLLVVVVEEKNVFVCIFPTVGGKFGSKRVEMLGGGGAGIVQQVQIMNGIYFYWLVQLILFVHRLDVVCYVYGDY